jgi:hypothetical protein
VQDAFLAGSSPSDFPAEHYERTWTERPGHPVALAASYARLGAWTISTVIWGMIMSGSSQTKLSAG